MNKVFGKKEEEKYGKGNIDPASESGEVSTEKTPAFKQKQKDPAFPQINRIDKKEFDNGVYELVDNGDIFPDRALVGGVISGAITIDDAIKQSQELKKKEMQNGRLDTPKGIDETKKDESIPLGDSVLSGLNKIAGVAKDVGSFVKEGAQEIAEKGVPNIPYGKVALEGATFGIVDSEFVPKTPGEALAYFGVSMLSSIPSGGIASSAVKTAFNATKFGAKAAGFISKMDDIADLSTNVARAKTAKTVATGARLAGATAENAAFGFATGYARGVVKKIKDERVKPLDYAIADAFLGAGATLALAPVIAGGVALAKKMPNSKFAKKEAARTFARQALDETGLAQSYAEKGFTKEFFDNIMQAGDSGNLTPDSDLEMTYKSLKRYNAVEPFEATKSQLEKAPELLLSVFKGDAEKTAKALFTEAASPTTQMLLGTSSPTPPLKSLYEGDVNLKSLMDAGKYPEALDYLAIKANDVVSSVEYQNWATYPAKVGPKEIARAKADLFTKTDRYANMPTLKQKVLGYIDNPTPENANALLGTTGTSYTKTGKPIKTVFNERDLQKLKTYNFEGNITKRLSNTEADEIAGDITQNWLNQMAGAVDGSNQRPFLRQNIGAVKDADDVINTVVTLNRDFHRNAIAGYANTRAVEEGLGKIDVEKIDVDSVRNAWVIRNAEEQQRLNVLKAQDISKQIKMLEADFKTKQTPDLKVKIQEASKRRTELQRAISDVKQVVEQAKADIFAANPDKADPLSVAFAEADKIYITPARAFADRVKNGEKIPYMQRFKDASAQVVDKPKPMETSAVDATKEAIKAAGEAERTAGQLSSLKKGFDRNNLSYIQRGSMVADAFTAMGISGLDMPKMNLLNSGMSMEKMARTALGENNPIQVAFLEPAKSADAAIKRDRDTIISQFKQLGLKAGTEESKVIFQILENGGPTRSMLDKYSPAAIEEMTKKSNWFKGQFNTLISRVNQELKKNGLKEVPFRKNYAPHHVQNAQSLWDSLVNGEIESAKAIADSFDVKAIDQNRTFFGFEKRRSGKTDYTNDIVEAFEAYLNPALRRIHMTGIIRDVDFAKHWGSENVQTFLQRFKVEALLGGEFDPNSKGMSTVKTLVNERLEPEQVKFFQKATDMVAKSALLLNVGNWGQNAISSLSNFMISGGSGLRGYIKMGTKPLREAMNKSSFLKTRETYMDIDGDSITSFTKFAKKAGNIFDVFSVKHAWATAYDYGAAEGLTGENLIKFSDGYASKMQAGSTTIDRPMVMNKVTSKAYTQFMTYVLNLWTTMAADLPALARDDSAIKAASQIVKFGAAASVANEVSVAAGIREPFDDSLIPGVSQLTRGGSAVVGSLVNFGRGVANAAGAVSDYSEGLNRDAKDKAIKAVGQFFAPFVPGGNQMRKVWEGAWDEKSKGVEKGRKMLFGKDPVQASIKKAQEERLINRGFVPKNKKEGLLEEAERSLVQKIKKKRIEKNAKKPLFRR